jgi:hypothetical protein
MDGRAVAGDLTPPGVTLGPRRYAIAGARDDADLRALLRDNPMAGWVSLSLEREPSYFAASGLGAEHHVIVARDTATGVTQGMCALERRGAFLNGAPRPLGYLGELRLARRARGNARLVRDGFRAVRMLLHDPMRTPFYLTAIVEDNRPARRLLAAGLTDFPTYRPLDVLNVVALRSTRRRCRAVPGLSLAPAAAVDMGRLAAFLGRELRRFQAAPVWDEGGLRSLPALAPEHFILAERAGEIIGCVALWDQRTMRQTVVRGYARPLSWARPLLNLIAPVTGLPTLPPVGTSLAHAFLSHLAVAQDDPAVFAAVVEAALEQARSRGIDLAVVGVADGHPLAAPLKATFRGRLYRSTLYLVYWDDGSAAADALDARPMHVELALM